MKIRRVSQAGLGIRLCGRTLVTVFVVASTLAQTESITPPPPGKLVDIGGWKLHLNCTGAGSKGSPTVVFESGAGGTSFDWYFVQGQVSTFATACSYDRAGTAWSDVGPHPRTIRQMEYELHSVLANAGLPGPYILVGHSFGGIMVRTFQAEYPSDVAGIVLVDAASDDTKLVHFRQLVHMREITSGRPIPPVRTTILASEQAATETEFGRAAPIPVAPAPGPSPTIAPAAQPEPTPRPLPPDVARLREWAEKRREVGTLPGDGDYTGQEFARLYEARTAHPHVLGDLPLVVLIARKREVPNNLPPEWFVSNEEINQQDEQLARMSTNGKFIYAENSAHLIPYYEPEVVTQAIRSVMDAAIRQRSRH